MPHGAEIAHLANGGQCGEAETHGAHDQAYQTGHQQAPIQSPSTRENKGKIKLGEAVGRRKDIHFEPAEAAKDEALASERRKFGPDGPKSQPNLQG